MKPDKTTVILKHGQSVRGKSGQKLTVIAPTPLCIVDSHMHIENGATVPLPLLYNQIKETAGIEPHFKRSTLDTLAKVIKRKAGVLQIKPTPEIGNIAVKENLRTFSSQSLIGQSDIYRNSDFFSPMIVMPMDMEYAHIAGYEGQTIYHEDEFPWYYYKREFGNIQENKGKKVLLPGENSKTFCDWYKQYKDTVSAVKNNPFKLIPMYHYEPRRWRGKSGNKLEESKWLYGSWEHPFNEIATKSQKGLFIGFKMYPPLGYRPLDERLPYLEQYYAKCQADDIPILAHCSPGGMTTHELSYYIEYCENLNPTSYNNYGASNNSMAQTDKTTVKINNGEIAVNYFYENYVHPKAWRKVLERFPKLRLCLAHFGGDEWQKGVSSDWIKEIIALMEDFPHVYTDFSCHDIKNNGKAFAHILSYAKHSPVYERLLFGTDWYMTLLALGGKGYSKFCEEYWELIADKDLWLRFTFINPFEFFGLNDEQKLSNLNESLKKLLKKDDEMQLIRETNFNILKRMIKEYRKLK